MRLHSKVAIVTGAGSGIGKAIAKRYAKECAVLVLADIEEDGLLEVKKEIMEISDQVEVTCLTGDVGKEEDCNRIVDFAKETYGRVDVLVNNAGISDVTAVCECEYSRWREVMSVNLDSHFLMSKRAIPVMADGGGGRIINIASAMGLVAHKMCASYSTSKAGAVQLTKQMALDYGEDNITVNAICPGIVDTPLVSIAVQDEELSNYYVEKTPLGRIGQPDDVANLAVFLASDEANFITGAAIPVDGGIIAGVDTLLGPG
ncbi:MAG: SDR family oxidoreductase [Desulfobacteraceae bacterium]|nr:SDR family oxidoreductase [Desulfobacteraceae bacterium]MBC2756554.1 SDR family oxidoreductase [Desulfobacteraceae bacterium]